jgi:hypothetical protein
MMAWWKWPLRFAIVAAALAIALDVLVLVTPRSSRPFEYEGPLQYTLKYLNFSALSKETLIRETEAYIRGVAGGDQMACLYVVACDGEHARLELVSDIAGWDLQAAKDRIWRRRFFHGSTLGAVHARAGDCALGSMSTTVCPLGVSMRGNVRDAESDGVANLSVCRRDRLSGRTNRS